MTRSLTLPTLALALTESDVPVSDVSVDVELDDVVSPLDDVGHELSVPPVPQVSELHASDAHGVLHARLSQAHASAFVGRPDAKERLLIVGTAAV